MTTTDHASSEHCIHCAQPIEQQTGTWVHIHHGADGEFSHHTLTCPDGVTEATPATDTADLLAEAADLVAQVLDDCDAHMAVRAGHGTGLVSDLQRWRHRAAAHCPASVSPTQAVTR